MATHSRGDNVVKSVSMTPDFWKDAEERSNKLKFRSFSEYVRRLIEKDLAVRGSMIISEEGAVAPAPPSKQRDKRLGPTFEKLLREAPRKKAKTKQSA